MDLAAPATDRIAPQARLAGGIVSLLVLLGPPGATPAAARGREGPAGEGEAREVPGPRAREPDGTERGSPDWLDLREGLRELRSRRLPALVWFDAVPSLEAGAAGAGDSAVPDVEALLGSGSAGRRLRRALVLVRLRPEDLEKPYPREPPRGGESEEAGKGGGPEPPPAPVPRAWAGKPAPPPLPPLEPPPGGPRPIGETLGLVPHSPALLILDFRERQVLRFEEQWPRARTFRRALARVIRAGALQVREAAKVEELVDQSREAHRRGRQREAVLLVRDLERPERKKRLDPVLRGRVEVLLAAYHRFAGEALEEAEKLERRGDEARPRVESERLYHEALRRLDKAIEEFPFPGVTRRANQRKGEILSKLTVRVP